MTSTTTSTTAVHLSPVHGGLPKPVHRIEPRDRVNHPAWRKLPSIEVNENDRTTLQRIADGTLSPLTGPMALADYRSALDRGAIERGGKLWAWTIPIILPITDEEAAKCVAGQEIGLVLQGESGGEAGREVFGK